MKVILQVISNLKHNETYYAAGTFFEAELAQFEQLVEDGVLRVVEGARDLAHAAEIVAAETAAKLQAEEGAAAQAETQNTWGPTKAPVVAPQDAATDTNAPQTTDAAKTDVAPAGTVGAGDVEPGGDNL